MQAPCRHEWGGPAVIPQGLYLTFRSAAEGWSVCEATMGAGEVVVAEPRGEMLIAFFGVGIVADISPLAKSGLDEGFGPRILAAISSTRLRPRPRGEV
jgi:hypothetical protein